MTTTSAPPPTEMPVASEPARSPVMRTPRIEPLTVAPEERASNVVIMPAAQKKSATCSRN